MKKIFSIVLCFTLLFSLLIVPVSAADSLAPSVPWVPSITEQVTIGEERTHYIILDEHSLTGTTTCLYSFFLFNGMFGSRGAFSVNSSFKGFKLTGTQELSFDFTSWESITLGYHKYKLVDNQWELVDSKNVVSSIVGLDAIYYGSFDVYDSQSGNLFFQNTPLLIYSEVVGESLATMEQTTMRTLHILTLCGVGLLALLMAFLLLSKKSLIFLR